MFSLQVVFKITINWSTHTPSSCPFTPFLSMYSQVVVPSCLCASKWLNGAQSVIAAMPTSGVINWGLITNKRNWRSEREVARDEHLGLAHDAVPLRRELLGRGNRWLALVLRQHAQGVLVAA
jgi:hypothetical protein